MSSSQQHQSKRVLAFLVLAVFPPLALTACGNLIGDLFGKAEDAGTDAEVVAVVDAEVAPAVVESSAPEAEPEPVDPAAPAKVVVVNRDAGAKPTDAGAAKADAAAAPAVDAGKIPTPTPGGLRIPSGFPSAFGSLKIPSGFPKFPN